MTKGLVVHLAPGGGCGRRAVASLDVDAEFVHFETLTAFERTLSTERPAVVLAELVADSEYLGQLNACVASAPHLQWIALLTADQRRDEAIRKLVAGDFIDYHTFPVDPARLRQSVGHALGMSSLRTPERPRPLRGDCGLVGSSPRMLDLVVDIGKVAGVEAPVLLHGESGTGKELAAKAIHARSGRRGAPFVAVNCGALPASLIDSELFGYERGAFTGANQRRIGRIEAAASGTVFLDEIGDLPLELQVHILRFLEEGTIDRLGGNSPVHPDTRVIAATNLDLEDAVADGRFREDLFYRLNVLRLELPPLRERPEDIELLARYFFERFRHERASGVRGFTRDAIRAMEGHEWPGNVRELINRVRRAMVMCERRLIGARDLGLDRRQHPRAVTTLEEARSDAERRALMTVLRTCRGNVTRAAEHLAISRVTMYRLMEKHDVRADALLSNA